MNKEELKALNKKLSGQQKLIEEIKEKDKQIAEIQAQKKEIGHYVATDQFKSPEAEEIFKAAKKEYEKYHSQAFSIGMNITNILPEEKQLLEEAVIAKKAFEKVEQETRVYKLVQNESEDKQIRHWNYVIDSLEKERGNVAREFYSDECKQIAQQEVETYTKRKQAEDRMNEILGEDKEFSDLTEVEKTEYRSLKVTIKELEGQSYSGKYVEIERRPIDRLEKDMDSRWEQWEEAHKQLSDSEKQEASTDTWGALREQPKEETGNTSMYTDSAKKQIAETQQNAAANKESSITQTKNENN